MNKRFTYIADFETGKTDNDKCFVWLWCVISLDGKHKLHGYNINTFFDWIGTKKNKIPITVYFHNLKYDGTYLMNWLLNNGFTYADTYDLQPKQYHSIIAKGQWYSITVRFNNCTITFRDSLKILNIPVSAIGKLVGYDKGDLGEHYNITDINYNADNEDITYCYNDCDIVRRGLLAMFEMDINKLTIASSSYADCKKPYKPDEWEKLYPDIGDIIDENIRPAYIGGWCYVNPDIAGNEVGKGGVIDVNSLYPSVLYDKPLPYGMPVKCITEDLNPDEVAIYKINITCELKKGYLPTIMKKTGKFATKTEYFTKTENMVMWVTNIDLQMIKTHYNCKYDLLFGYKFKTLPPDKSPLHKYIDKWINVKIKATEENNKIMRQIAKIMLNSIYGKYGSRRTGHKQIPTLNTRGALSLQENPTVERMKSYYLPVAIFCTSYAREKTISTAQKINALGKFCYSDTDSIHFTDLTIEDLQRLGIDVHPTRLGAWDYEKSFDRAKFVRQKCYIEETAGNIDVKICGCPKEINHVPLNQLVNFDNFKIGLTLDGKLSQKSLEGGTYLYPTTFTLL